MKSIELKGTLVNHSESGMCHPQIKLSYVFIILYYVIYYTMIHFIFVFM